jgi:lipopolysaccharide transport system permease protein
MPDAPARYENIPLIDASPWQQLTAWTRHRHLLFHLVTADLRARYRRSYLGILWALIWPMAFSAIFTTVAINIFNAPFGSYVTYVVTGFVLWDFLAGAISGGATCFQAAEGYMRQTRLPYTVFALRSVSTLLVNFAFGSVAAASLIALATPEAVTWTWLLWPAVALSAYAFALPCAIMSGLAHLKFRDYQHAVGLALFMMWYLSPVLMARQVYESPQLALFTSVNPIASFCDVFRNIMMLGRLPEAHDLGVLALSTVGLWTVALSWFAAERKNLVHWM